ncbi:recombinase family protein [Edwardsiella tarda]|uniref:recombinase family protein n=1 Tax=Edwardsiella tarda TaxID=636 RepID=UPI00351C5634
MQYAYIRVSSADQNTARQEEALSKAGFQPDKICVEHASAKDTNRPGLQELLGQWHCCKVSDEAAFCLIQRPYISKTLLTRRISPRGSP